jgi:hypothetical protein
MNKMIFGHVRKMCLFCKEIKQNLLEKIKIRTMKKITIIFLALVLGLALSTHAQKEKQVILGLGGSFNSVWIIKQNMWGTPEFDYAPKLGGAAIFQAGYQFTEQIAAVTELGYAFVGQKYEGKVNFTYGSGPTPANFSGDAERNLSLSYLNVPVFFKYTFGAGLTRFRFMAGPQFSFLMKAEQEWTLDGDEFNPSIFNEISKENFDIGASDVKDRFENFDVGATIDVGADIYLSKEFFIGAGFRGTYGFNDINAPDFRMDDHDGAAYESSNNFYGGITVSVNYMIDVESYKQRNF